MPTHACLCRPVAAAAGPCQLLPIPAKCDLPQVTAGPCVRAFCDSSFLIFRQSDVVKAPQRDWPVRQVTPVGWSKAPAVKRGAGFRVAFAIVGHDPHGLPWGLLIVCHFIERSVQVAGALTFRAHTLCLLTLTGRDAFCAAQTRNLAAARRPKPWLGREKGNFVFLANFRGTGAQARRQFGGPAHSFFLPCRPAECGLGYPWRMKAATRSAARAEPTFMKWIRKPSFLPMSAGPG